MEGVCKQASTMFRAGLVAVARLRSKVGLPTLSSLRRSPPGRLSRVPLRREQKVSSAPGGGRRPLDERTGGARGRAPLASRCEWGTVHVRVYIEGGECREGNSFASKPCSAHTQNLPFLLFGK